MDYQFENLGPERFQEFCSTLISKEFPNIQALPVGQPDGGRDSIVYHTNLIEKTFNVFQVKFLRDPKKVDDVYKWLVETFDKEKEKVNNLIERGAKCYYILTNLKGSAHLDVGLKDKINKYLEENIKIPSICWWRDDIARMFEKDVIFKWSFPEILNGQDVLNSCLFNNITEQKDRRENVIRAYLSDQYSIDNEVKFKQINLKNNLLSLFTDVPIQVKKLNKKNRNLIEIFKSLSWRETDYDSFEGTPHMGAAHFLLHSQVQEKIGKILLEGGPGQGKSTISQFICQVHRVKLLEKNDELNSLEDRYKNTAVRLPFKIDLRDVALWIENVNPYQDSLSEEYFKKIWSRSLESFLVAHIFFHSKLEDFSGNDLIAICKVSSVLMVFDGFDEIADMNLRSEIIDLLNKGLNRISQNSKSLQVLITSRPAAFSDSIGFEVENYPHMELSDITPAIITEYLDKWVLASDLTLREGDEIKKLVHSKLELPHLKDLTKSPMQLAILISLLKTKGHSLPNKRTALYDNYINLFFDRESEKSKLILEHRELIVNIHQYVAWILHSEAELFKNSGSMQQDQLIQRLREYLIKDGHDGDIADQLFNVLNERVCALVSRVQGTFEFEVQPLREYFCAKYLYETAPHSSAGNEKSGSKPERLHAILRNFYWQNVVRFFAGCVGKGELNMLIEELIDLQEDIVLKYTDYPRILTSQILSDYVFTQTPKKVSEVVKLLTDKITSNSLINQHEHNSSNEKIRLPIGCGREELFVACLTKLRAFPVNDYMREIIETIRSNPFNLIQNYTNELITLSGTQLTLWLDYGEKLNILNKVEKNILRDILDQSSETELKARLLILVKDERTDLIHENPIFKKVLLSAILDGEIHSFNSKDLLSFEFISLLFNPYIESHLLSRSEIDRSVIDQLSHYYFRHVRHENNLISEFEVKDELDKQIKAFSLKINSFLESDSSILSQNFDLWDQFIETGREFFGNCNSLRNLAAIAAKVTPKAVIEDKYSDLSDDALSICKRVRYARMKSGNVNFWRSQLDTENHLIFKLHILLLWGTANTLVAMYEILKEKISNLTTDEFDILTRNLAMTAQSSTSSQKKIILHALKKRDDYNRINYLLSLRFSHNQVNEIVFEFINNPDEDLKQRVHILKIEYLLKDFFANPKDIKTLEKISDIYVLTEKYEITYYYHFLNESKPIPYDIAKTIMDNRMKYPRIIATYAEKTCRYNANKMLEPIGKIAKAEKWFDD